MAGKCLFFNSLPCLLDKCKTFVIKTVAFSSFFKLFFFFYLFKRNGMLLDGCWRINLKTLHDVVSSLSNIYTFDRYTGGSVNKIIACVNPEFQLKLIKPYAADDIWVNVFVVNVKRI